MAESLCLEPDAILDKARRFKWEALIVAQRLARADDASGQVTRLLQQRSVQPEQLP